nr:MAG TPA: transmembrane protein [Bacteriophage sp.]
MSNRIIVRNGIGFPSLLFIVLLVCKLFGASISWVWVFSPLWIPFLLTILFILIFAIYCFLKMKF